MTALSWARLVLLSSACWLGIFLADAVASESQALALINGVFAGGFLMTGAMALRYLLRDLRRRELMRCRRVLALRGLACYHVFEDRCAPGNPRGHLASCAMLSATRALDELVSVRVAMGASAL